MSKEEMVEVTIRVPKNVLVALREFCLKYETVTEKEFWTREAIQLVVSDIDCVCSIQKLDPVPILKHYDLLKHTRYPDKQEQSAEEMLKKYYEAKAKKPGLTFPDFLDTIC